MGSAMIGIILMIELGFTGLTEVLIGTTTNASSSIMETVNKFNDAYVLLPLHSNVDESLSSFQILMA
jgi:hypothetical protein